MKKTLFVVAVAAIAMTACTNEKNEYVGSGSEQKEIAFKAISQPTTRTAYDNAVPSTDFPDNYTMQVVAYDIPNSGTAKEYFGGTTGVEFANGYSGGSPASGTNWGGTTPQYWPLYKSTLNFFAVTNSNNRCFNI